MPAVLISGGGIAGSTLAFLLAGHGFQVTVVERARGLRSAGSPVDVRGAAVPVAERMGIMPQVREAGTGVVNLTFVNAQGRRTGRINLRALRRAGASREVELHRGDLAAILHHAARDRAEYLFDDSVAALHDDGGHGVDVSFERAAPGRFDVVVGADGLHSTVRRLSFGPERDSVRHLGVYVATLPLAGPTDHGRDVLVHNTPGRAATVHPGHGHAVAAFLYRAPEVAGFDHRDTDQHRRLLTSAYAGVGWRVPELLDRVRATDDLYFDSVSQVRLPVWSRGRVVLLGDAAACVSLFGDGSSLAIAGAATLADALAAEPDDYQAAFRRYEGRHRTLVEPRQRAAGAAKAVLIPATWAGIAARNLATRFWPVAAAAQWLRRPLRAARLPS